MLKEKEPIINERVEQSPARIDKLEEIFNNLGSAFSSVKTIEKTPPNKLISVHPNCVDKLQVCLCP